jgi:hypothetical protein
MVISIKGLKLPLPFLHGYLLGYGITVGDLKLFVSLFILPLKTLFLLLCTLLTKGEQ